MAPGEQLRDWGQGLFTAAGGASCSDGTRVHFPILSGRSLAGSPV